MREEREASARAELIANEALGPLLVPSDRTSPLTGERFAAMDQRVDSVRQAQPGIVRIKIWGPEGHVLYSDDRSLVGTQPGIGEELGEAFEGHLENEISDLTAGENGSERQVADKLFETYVPFRFDGEEEVFAVIEVYQDYSVIQAEIDRLTRTLSISLGVGLLVLYAVLLPLMIGITRTLRRQNHRLQEQAGEMATLLEREQDTVAELRELDRMKSDFVAATSHELRTPLTSIRGYVHILRESALAEDPVAVEALGAIERQSSRLFRLIGNVLRESNLEHEDTTNAVFLFPFTDLVDEVTADFHDTGKRIVTRPPRRPAARHPRSPPGAGRAREPGRQRAEVLVATDARRDRRACGCRRRSRSGCRDEGIGIDPGRPPADLRSLLSGRPVRDPLVRGGRAGPPHRRRRWSTPSAGRSTCRARRGWHHVHRDRCRSRAMEDLPAAIRPTS